MSTNAIVGKTKTNSTTPPKIVGVWNSTVNAGNLTRNAGNLAVSARLTAG
jgi:hypothetical protein